MPWWVWLVAALALGGLELLTATFVLLWIGIAALVTAVVAVCTPVLWVQALVFFIVGGGLLWFTRPLARRMRQKRTYAAVAESLPGQTAVVVHPGEPGGLSTVRVGGQLWSARCRDPLTIGQTVQVTAVHGAVLEVAAASGLSADRRERGGEQG